MPKFKMHLLCGQFFCRYPFAIAKNLKYSCFSHFNPFSSNSSLLLCSVIDLFSLHKNMQSMPRCNQAYSKCEYKLLTASLLPSKWFRKFQINSGFVPFELKYYGENLSFSELILDSLLRRENFREH